MCRERGLHEPFLDARVALVAAGQGGVVSAGQLRAAGLSGEAIKSWARHGRLHRLHRGVYALGHPSVTGEGRRWAAVLATGGVLSHLTAAAMWDLVGWPSGPIDVTTLRESRSAAGIRVHRGQLEQREITSRDGLPVTTAMRALLDCATALNAFRFGRAVHRAAQLNLLDATYDPAKRPGAARLRAQIAALATEPPRITKSDLEELFLKLIHDFGLPPPLTNVLVNGVEVDAYWPDARLIVELDSREWHDNPLAFEADRERDTARRTAARLRRLLI